MILLLFSLVVAAALAQSGVRVITVNSVATPSKRDSIETLSFPVVSEVFCPAYAPYVVILWANSSTGTPPLQVHAFPKYNISLEDQGGGSGYFYTSTGYAFAVRGISSPVNENISKTGITVSTTPDVPVTIWYTCLPTMLLSCFIIFETHVCSPVVQMSCTDRASQCMCAAIVSSTANTTYNGTFNGMPTACQCSEATIPNIYVIGSDVWPYIFPTCNHSTSYSFEVFRLMPCGSQDLIGICIFRERPNSDIAKLMRRLDRGMGIEQCTNIIPAKDLFRAQIINNDVFDHNVSNCSLADGVWRFSVDQAYADYGEEHLVLVAFPLTPGNIHKSTRGMSPFIAGSDDDALNGRGVLASAYSWNILNFVDEEADPSRLAPLQTVRFVPTAYRVPHMKMTWDMFNITTGERFNMSIAYDEHFNQTFATTIGHLDAAKRPRALVIVAFDVTEDETARLFLAARTAIGTYFHYEHFPRNGAEVGTGTYDTVFVYGVQVLQAYLEPCNGANPSCNGKGVDVLEDLTKFLTSNVNGRKSLKGLVTIESLVYIGAGVAGSLAIYAALDRTVYKTTTAIAIYPTFNCVPMIGSTCVLNPPWWQSTCLAKSSPRLVYIMYKTQAEIDSISWFTSSCNARSTNPTDRRVVQSSVFVSTGQFEYVYYAVAHLKLAIWRMRELTDRRL